MWVHVLGSAGVWCAMALVSLLAPFAGGCVGRAETFEGRAETVDAASDTDGAPSVDFDAGSPVADAAVNASLVLTQAGGTAPIPRDAARGLRRFARVELELHMEALDEVSLTVGGDTTRWPVSGLSRLVHSLDISEDGPLTVAARGFLHGKLVREATLTVDVTPPTDPSCFGHLDALKVDWSAADPRPGIDEPVVVGPQFAGLVLRHRAQAAPKAVVADCEFAIRLAAMAETLLPYEITELVHLGIYNYRCVGGGNPSTDGCKPSQHAYARALDIHELVDREGQRFNVEDDWIITDEVACEPFGDRPEPRPEEPDALLRAVACDLFRSGVFHIVLTPNYNAAHRNHLHVDVTPGASSLHELIVGVDPKGLVMSDGHR